MATHRENRPKQFSKRWWLEVIIAGILFTAIGFISVSWDNFPSVEWEFSLGLLVFSPVIGFVYKLLEDLIYFWFGDKKKA